MGSILQWLKGKVMGAYLSNLIRHALTALGAILIANGLPADVVLPWQDATINLAIQALPIILSLLWSILEKKALKKV